MEFEWHAAKAESNFRKHGVSFEAAVEVFDDPDEVTDHGKMIGGEWRYQTIGRVGRVILFVVFTLREDDGVPRRRIISARRASREERLIYGQP